MEDYLENERYAYQELLETHKELFNPDILIDYDLEEINSNILDNSELTLIIQLTNFFNAIFIKKRSRYGSPSYGKITSADVRNYIVKNNDITMEYISRAKVILCLIKAGFEYKQINSTPTFNIEINSYNLCYSINDEFRYNPEMKKYVRTNGRYNKNYFYHVSLKKILIDTYNTPIQIS